MSTTYTNLKEVREWALRQGFTSDQFGYAIDRVGSDPHHVADELQRHLSKAAINTGHPETE